MEIKNCPFCEGTARFKCVDGTFHDMGGMKYWYAVECELCESRTEFHESEKLASDAWNSRVEQNPSEADRWLKEAIEQRARADLAEMQRDELAEDLSQAQRMLAYSGNIQ